MNRSAVYLLVAALFAGCATPRSDDVDQKANRKLVVKQVGMNSAAEFVACKVCQDRTKKVIAVPSPPVQKLVVQEVVAAPAVVEPKVYKVHFRFGKSALDRAGRAELSAITAALKNQKGEITVLGRTDPVGSPVVNRRLALLRAQSVRKGLIAGGVESSSIKAARHEPCCDGDTHAGASIHREQRRADVEIILTTK